MPQKLPNNLVIAFRLPEEDINIQQLELYINHLKSLNPKQIICATSDNNPGLPVMKALGVKVFEYSNFTNLHMTKVIMDFYDHAKEHHLLTISYGVELYNWQLEHGFEILRSRNLLCIGWRILQQENDGSYLGRLAYNTCMLHEPGFYDKVIQAGGMPEYIENGKLGTVSVDLNGSRKEIRIGGQEDLAIQLKLYKYFIGKKHKLFGHIIHYGINYRTQNQPEEKLNEKLIRKVITADLYRRLEDINPKDFMDSWVII